MTGTPLLLYCHAVPRVSVIVPAHNAARTIAETLRSIQAQTYRDYEVVVCDDASSDDTVERVRSLNDPRVHVVAAPRNLGPAGARNIALSYASGELIAFLDSDDWWREGYLDKQVARYDAETQQPAPPVGLVACNALLAGPDGSIEAPTYFDLFGKRQIQPVTLEKLLRRNTIFVSCLVPRSVGDAVGWFDEELFGTEDHDLWLKIVESGHRVVVQTEPLVVYRRTASSISRNTSRQGLNNQRTLMAALQRGRLTPAQQRVARSELRYNRALEVVAAAAFDRRLPPVSALPTVGWVAVTRPSHWRQWLSALVSR